MMGHQTRVAGIPVAVCLLLSGLAEAGPGQTPSRNGVVLGLAGGLAVQLDTGELQCTARDLSIPGTGMDLDFVRVYGSQRGYEGPFGRNWSHGYDQRVSLAGATLAHFDGGRLQEDLYYDAGGSVRTCATAGVYRKARQDGSGEWVIRDPSGMKYRFHAIDGSPAAGRLKEVVDPFGNRITCRYEGDRLSEVVDTAGRSIFLGYTASGRIETVTDFSGRVWRYGYNGAGDPETVTTPAIVGTPVNPADGQANDFSSGRTTRYGYAPDGSRRLESVTNPREAMAGPGGIPVVTVTYEGERVKDAAVGSGTYRMTYPEPLKTRVTDRAGNETEYVFNNAGQALRVEQFTNRDVRPGDPASYVTANEYNAHGELTKTTLPDGETVECVYNTASPDHFRRGNLLKRTHRGAGGSPTALSTDYTYEPVYNGRSGSAQSGMEVTYDYQEGDWAATGMNVLVSMWGIPVPAGFGKNLGDINGDGVVNQTGGNPIRQRSAEYTEEGTTRTRSVRVSTYDARGRLKSEATPEGSLSAYSYDDGAGGVLSEVVRDADPGLAPNAGAMHWRKTGVARVNARTVYGRDLLGRLTSVTDPRGVKTVFVVNSLGEVQKKTEGAEAAGGIDPGLAALQGAGYGHMAAPGYDSYYRYDGNGNVVRVDEENVSSGDPGNGWWTAVYEYDGENRLTSERVEVDPARSEATGYAYDANGNLRRETFPRGNFNEYVHDERDLLYREIRGAQDPQAASTTTCFYDANGRRVRIEGPEDLDGDGKREALLTAYDGRGRFLEGTEPVGTQERASYDANDYVTYVRRYGRPGGASARENSTQGNVLLSESRGRYDEIGRLMGVLERRFQLGTDPLPYAPVNVWETTSQVLDRDGLVTKQTDPKGRVSEYAYDGLGRLIRATDAVGNRLDYTYDAGGNLLKQEALEGTGERKVRTHVYDGLGRLIRSTNDLWETAYFAYDSRGNRVAEADAKGPAGADPLGIAGGPINRPGNTKRFLVDGRSLVIEVRSDLHANGEGTGYDLWAAGFEPSTDPAGVERVIRTRTEYDGNGNIERIVSGEGKALQFAYDGQDRLRRKTLPDGSWQETGYWRDGSVASHALHEAGGALFRRQVTGYDGSGRVVRQAVELPAGSRIEGTREQAFEYNGLDLVTRATDDNGEKPDSVVACVYDSLGNVLQEMQDGKPVSSRYDAAGNRTGLWYPGAARRVEYAYDALDRLSAVTEGSGSRIAAYTYYGTGRVAKKSLGPAGSPLEESYETARPGSGEANGYDRAGRPVNLEHRLRGGMVDVTSHVYDRAGRRREEARTLGANPSERKDILEGDSLGRLKRAQRNKPAGAPAELTEEREYDGDSAWTRLTLRKAGQAASAYGFEVGTGWEYGAIAGKAIGHDAAGNRTSDFWFLYFHDGWDRLVRIAQNLGGAQAGPTVVEFAYDATGRRIEKRAMAGLGVNPVVRYFYEGSQIVEEQGEGGAMLAQYVYGDGIDEPLEMRRGGNAFYYLLNTLGSVAALADSAGQAVERYRYDAFGGPIFQDAEGTVNPGQDASLYGNPYFFTGREYDAETAAWKRMLGGVFGYFTERERPLGQYYYRARYMDPEEGRFASRDPLALANNDPTDPALLFSRILDDGLLESPYAYVANDPADNSDPEGLQRQRPPIPLEDLLVLQDLSLTSGTPLDDLLFEYYKDMANSRRWLLQMERRQRQVGQLEYQYRLLYTGPPEPAPKITPPHTPAPVPEPNPGIAPRPGPRAGGRGRGGCGGGRIAGAIGKAAGIAGTGLVVVNSAMVINDDGVLECVKDTVEVAAKPPDAEGIWGPVTGAMSFFGNKGECESMKRLFVRGSTGGCRRSEETPRPPSVPAFGPGIGPGGGPRFPPGGPSSFEVRPIGKCDRLGSALLVDRSRCMTPRRDTLPKSFQRDSRGRVVPMSCSPGQAGCPETPPAGSGPAPGGTTPPGGTGGSGALPGQSQPRPGSMFAERKGDSVLIRFAPGDGREGEYEILRTGLKTESVIAQGKVRPGEMLAATDVEACAGARYVMVIRDGSGGEWRTEPVAPVSARSPEAAAALAGLDGEEKAPRSRRRLPGLPAAVVLVILLGGILGVAVFRPEGGDLEVARPVKD